MAAIITDHINTIIPSVLSFSPEKSFTPPPIPIPDTLKGIDDLIHAGFEAYRSSCFNWLLAATGLVVVGLVLEGPELGHEIKSIVHHWRFTHRFHFGLPENLAPNWAKLAAFVGWFFIVLGVAGEYVADSFVSKADGYVQTFDEILLAEGQKRTAFANERATGAYERAAKTEREAAQENARAAQAEKEVAEENARAAKALEAAEAARKNAEGFQLQVAQSNERAARAEQRAADSALELARIKSPRSLTHIPEVTAALSLFKGTEYTFIGVCADDECFTLLMQLDGVLQNSGWKRDKPVGGFPAINVFGKDNPYSVPQALVSGIKIFVDSLEPLAILQSKQNSELSPSLRAAIALDVNLFSNLSPPQNNEAGNKVIVESGTSTIVRISIGRKQI